ncbi:hypothetical protein UFOVP773_7 [uncultured Caudovirales phage]|uniref:Scaffolding protein n=1 Tax=uncultured Caudovirales phage TaxID=2100421 RepID=A0A6J5NP35_9CAUD|nr:hypothetical protein UFOVP773_7 [uncultured Caudovirales phage]
MSEEVIAEQPAPEQVATAAPEPEIAAPEVAPEGEQNEPAKVFTQGDLDAAIGKRLAREQRKWEREQKQAEAPKPVPVEQVRPEQFTTTDEYVEALTTSKAQQIVQQQQFEKQRQELIGGYHDKEEVARDKYEDFEQVAYNPKLPITDVMAQTIQASDNGPDIAYFLGTNPKEADRISRLVPLLQAKEIGRLEAKIASDPVTKQTSKAPAPISPVTPRNGGSSSFDTTDARSIKTMTTSQWIDAERQRQVKILEAKRSR